MSQRLVELCTLLVQNAYGDLAAKLFSHLAHLGRLSFLHLRQLSAIAPHRLKVGLSTLIQHHLIRYHAADEDEPTFFQVDWVVAYSLLRCHKFLNIVGDREGENAKQMVANVLQLGHTTIGDLANEYELQQGAKREDGADATGTHVAGLTNGIAKPDNASSGPEEKKMNLAEFHDTLRRLLSQGILVKINDRTYMPRADLQELIKETVINEEFPDGKITGPKKSKEFQAAVDTLKRKYQEEDSFSDTKDIASHGDIKRTTSSKSSNKRTKMSHLANGVHHDTAGSGAEANTPIDKLPNDMIVRVDFDKCTVLLRDDRMVQTVDRFLGPVTASVFRAFLRALETQTKSLYDTLKMGDVNDDYEYEEGLPSVTDVEVLEYLDKTADLGAGLYQAVPTSQPPNGVIHKRKRLRNDADEGDEVDDNIRQGSKRKRSEYIADDDNGDHPQQGDKSKNLQHNPGENEKSNQQGAKRKRSQQVPDDDEEEQDIQQAVKRRKAQKIPDDDNQKNTQPGVKQEVPSDSEAEEEMDSEKAFEERQKRLKLVDMHMHILAEHPKRFCIRSDGANSTSIDFAALAKTLVQIDLDAMILARYGQVPLRLVRILRQYKKLDDRQLAEMSMQRLKDLRATLTLLQIHGILEGQELPKDNGRQPNRSFYLWWFDEDRVRSRWAECAYQGMARCLQRWKAARDGRFSGVIEKAERLGVPANGDGEEQLLNVTERDQLKKWREVEETLLTQVERLDDLMGVLRDFSGKDVSLMT